MIVYESNTNWSIGILTVNPEYHKYRVDGIELLCYENPTKNIA
jgi:hypothetical protein